MERAVRGAADQTGLAEELGDERDERDHRVRGVQFYVRIVVMALVPERLARIVYSPFAAVPPKLP
jgi:hypothetical protein